MTRPLRWGIIGAGRFGHVHARALKSLPGVELVALCRRDAKELAKSAGELNVPKTSTKFEEILADPEIDVVTICTHWRDHVGPAVAALESGKHVLLEKPMAASSEECQAILAAARQSPGILMVGHVCRFDPRITLAKEAIAAGHIGRILSMHAKRNLPVVPGPIRLDKISPLMGDGIHDTDLMMWFMGEVPTRVFARNIRVDDHVYPDIGWAMLEFGDRALGVVETNWRLPKNVPTAIDARFEVVGTDGQLTIDCANTGLNILDASGLRIPDTAYWPAQHDHIVGALRNELLYFAECVRMNRRPAVITPEEAARAVAVMEVAEQSAAEGVPLEVSSLPAKFA